MKKEKVGKRKTHHTKSRRKAHKSCENLCIAFILFVAGYEWFYVCVFCMYDLGNLTSLLGFFPVISRNYYFVVEVHARNISHPVVLWKTRRIKMQCKFEIWNEDRWRLFECGHRKSPQFSTGSGKKTVSTNLLAILISWFYFIFTYFINTHLSSPYKARNNFKKAITAKNVYWSSSPSSDKKSLSLFAWQRIKNVWNDENIKSPLTISIPLQ